MSVPFALLARCLDFDGRAPRRALGRFLLFGGAMGGIALSADSRAGRAAAVLGATGPMTALVVLLLALPLAALIVRRLHDSGLPGGWIALLAAPGAGWLWLAALLARPGVRGANRFGVDPLGRGRRADFARAH